MGYNSIRIERERQGFCVRATDPKIEEENRKRDHKCDGPVASWKDPNVEFKFDTAAQVLKFIEKAIDIALPADEYSTAFDKAAKEAMND